MSTWCAFMGIIALTLYLTLVGQVLILQGSNRRLTEGRHLPEAI